MLSSAFGHCPWPSGTKPTIPSLTGDAAYLNQHEPWLLSRLGSKSFQFNTMAGALADLERGKSVKPTLPFRTPHYETKIMPVNYGFPEVSRVFLVHVSPQQILGVKPGFRAESVHNFYYLVQGFFFALAFETEEARQKMVERFLRQNVPPESREVFRTMGNGIHFSPAGWDQAGTLPYNGRNLSLALFTPQAFFSFVETSPFIFADPETTHLGAVEFQETPDATYFFREKKPLGFMARDGKLFLCREIPGSAGVGPGSSASHKAILQRQVDPFGLGISAGSKSMELKQALEIVRVFKSNHGLHDAPTHEMSDELFDVARLKLEKIKQVLLEKRVFSDFERRVLTLQVGMPEMASSQVLGTRYLRFVYIRGKDGQDPVLISCDAPLLHVQMLALLLEPHVVSNMFYSPGSDMRIRVVGGVLEINPKNQMAMKVMDDQMLLPDPGQDPKRVVMSDEIKSEIEDFLNRGR